MACLCSLTVRSPFVVCSCSVLFFFLRRAGSVLSHESLWSVRTRGRDIGGTPFRRGSRRWVHRGAPSRRHHTLANRCERVRQFHVPSSAVGLGSPRFVSAAFCERWYRCLPGVRFSRSCSESFAIPFIIRWWCGLILPSPPSKKTCSTNYPKSSHINNNFCLLLFYTVHINVILARSIVV